MSTSNAYPDSITVRQQMIQGLYHVSPTSDELDRLLDAQERAGTGRLAENLITLLTGYGPTLIAQAAREDYAGIVVMVLEEFLDEWDHPPVNLGLDALDLYTKEIPLSHYHQGIVPLSDEQQAADDLFDLLFGATINTMLTQFTKSSNLYEAAA